MDTKKNKPPRITAEGIRKVTKVSTLLALNQGSGLIVAQKSLRKFKV